MTDLTNALDTLSAMLADKADATRGCAVLDQLVDALIGRRLFTVMQLVDQGARARRLYTSHPVEYPQTGWKETPGSAWSKLLLTERRPFVANSHAEIAELLPDHDVLLGLGIESLVNLPVELNGDVVGTVNFGHAAGHMSQGRLEHLRALTLPAQLVFLMENLAAS